MNLYVVRRLLLAANYLQNILLITAEFSKLFFYSSRIFLHTHLKFLGLDPYNYLANTNLLYNIEQTEETPVSECSFRRFPLIN